MRKKILIAEKSDAIRSIAESILHQHGYDVIPAATAGKAREFIVSAKPNMLIIGAALKTDEGKYLYEELEKNNFTATIPLLLISDPENPGLLYPDEVVLPRPFEPGDFIDRVRLFIGGGEKPEEKIQESPIPLETVSDDFLDSALGIDRIEVEESEIMDKTHISQKIRQIIIENKKQDVFDIHHKTGDVKNQLNDSGFKVESIMIRDNTEVPHKPSAPDKTKTGKNQSDSSGLDIITDQYGLISGENQKTPEIPAKTDKTKESHDYDWFINEMKGENIPTDTGKGKSLPKSQEEPLQKRETSETIEPISLPAKKEFQPGTGVAREPVIKSGGVDKFISDFKKEVEKINHDSGKIARSQPARNDTPVAVEEKPPIESLELHHYLSNMVEIIAEKVAKNIVDKIDKNEIYEMIRMHLRQLNDKR